MCIVLSFIYGWCSTTSYHWIAFVLRYDLRVLCIQITLHLCYRPALELTDLTWVSQPWQQPDDIGAPWESGKLHPRLIRSGDTLPPLVLHLGNCNLAHNFCWSPVAAQSKIIAIVNFANPTIPPWGMGQGYFGAALASEHPASSV
jgi:hypothetical protein